MRRFVILGHTQRTKPPIPLNDPSGAGGRWDLLARCVTSALLVSHGIRTDTEVTLVLRSDAVPRTVRVPGQGLRRLNPDERSTVALLSKALEATDVGEHEASLPEGVHISARGLERVLEDAAKEGPLVLLREDATLGLEEWRPGVPSATFVLSDHRDPSADELAIVRRHQPLEVSLGPVALQADQCIPIVHNRLDRAAARLPPLGSR